MLSIWTIIVIWGWVKIHLHVQKRGIFATSMHKISITSFPKMSENDKYKLLVLG